MIQVEGEGQPRGRWLRSLIWAGIAVAVVLTVLSFLSGRQVNGPAALVEDDHTRTLNSLQKVNDYPLYTMTYYGDYGFDALLEAGEMPAVPGRVARLQGDACSTITAWSGDDERLMGRNFDWIHHAALLLYTDSPTGYASATMVDIAYLGFDEEIPADSDLTSLLDAPFWPMDGMNEHGLAVSQMAVPTASLIVDPDKPTLDSLGVIRLVLDHARTVDEAIDLVGGINIDWEGGPTLHYLFTDANGDSAVVEFIGGEMVVTREDTPWQVATNFNLYGIDPEQRPAHCWRYAQAQETLADSGGQLSGAAFRDLVASIAGDWGDAETMWSVIYNLTSGEIEVVMGRRFDEVDRFVLEMAGD